MDGIKKFVLEFSQRYDDFGELDCFTGRYDGGDCSANIDLILDRVQDTFKYCKIPVEEDSSKTNPKCVKALKVLLLNTQFECHDILKRDPAYGPTAKMNCPKMTPYLLMEIVRRLKYEQILAESLLHMPLDLCVEIIKLVIENIYMFEFDRGFNLVMAIILNCHKNLIYVWKNGIQSCDLKNALRNLLLHAHHFMVLLSTPKFLRLFEVDTLEKCERTGIILKKIISLTYKGLSGCDKDAVSPEIAENYRLRFGNDPIVKSEDNFEQQLRMFNQMLMHTLLKKLEEIDKKMYNQWVCLEDNGNSSVSLQHSIRGDLYNFMEFLKIEKKWMCSKSVMELLEKFHPLPVNIVSPLNLDELRYGSVVMKMEALRNIMPRYREWDHETFDLIQRHRDLIDVTDISYLIDYLALIMTKPGQQYHKRKVFLAIRRVLFYQHVGDDDWVMPIDTSDDESDELPQTELNESWKTASDESLDPDMKSDDLECLDYAYNEDHFKTFIADGKDIKSPKHLKTTLSYLLVNPSNILQIIIAVIIGVPDYEHLSLLPGDLIFFHPVIQLRDRETPLLLIEIRNVLASYNKWDARKFIDFIRLMLNEYKFTANDFVTHVLVWLIENEPTDVSGYMLVLKFVQDFVFEKCTAPLDVLPFVEASMHRLKRFRTDLEFPRSVSDELFIEIRRTVTPFLKLLEFNDGYAGNELEPIDRLTSPFIKLQPSLIITDTLGSTSQINIGYLCLGGLERARNVEFGERLALNPGAPNHVTDLFYLEDDFARYIIIKGTETEMVEFVQGLLKGQSTNPDTRIKSNTLDNISRLTIESAIYLLEFPDLNPPETFACLMHGFVQYLGYVMTHIVEEFNMWQTSCQFRQNMKRMRQLCSCWTFLAYMLRTMRQTIRRATFYPFYEVLMDAVDDPAMHNLPCGVALCKIRNALEKFSNDCLSIPHTEVRFYGPHTLEALDVKMKHEFIHECMTVQGYSNDGESKYQKLCATLRKWHHMK